MRSSIKMIMYSKPLSHTNIICITHHAVQCISKPQLPIYQSIINMEWYCQFSTACYDNHYHPFKTPRHSLMGPSAWPCFIVHHLWILWLHFAIFNYALKQITRMRHTVDNQTQNKVQGLGPMGDITLPSETALMFSRTLSSSFKNNDYLNWGINIALQYFRPFLFTSSQTSIW